MAHAIAASFGGQRRLLCEATPALMKRSGAAAHSPTTAIMSADFLANPRWREVVLTAGGRSYDWIDVFLSAMWRGEWRPFEHDLLAGLACQAVGADPRGIPPHDRALRAAAEHFRYERSLISADETIAWLERSGLTIESWGDYLLRGILRERWRDQVDALPGCPASAPVSALDVAVEGICSGTFDRFAGALAGRVAIALSGGLAREAAAGDGAVERTLRDHAAWLRPLATSDTRARLVTIAQHEHAFDVHARSAITTDALAWQIDRHRLAWTRVDLERLAFASADAAHEAACSARHDQRCLIEIAIDAREPVRDTRDLLERLEPELHQAVISACPGEFVGPITVASHHELVWVLAKRPPDLDDPLVHARAAEAVVEQAVSRAMLAHVRWEAPHRPRRPNLRQAAGRGVA